MTKRNPRRGFTLIEMVLVMGLGAIGLAMITAAIHTMFNLRSAEDRRDEVAKQVHEVAVRFREDAHNALGVVDKVDALRASESVLIFNKKGKGFVVWQSDETGVRRGEIAENKPPVWETKLDLLREPKAVFKADKFLAKMDLFQKPRTVFHHQLCQTIEGAIGMGPVEKATGGKP